MSDHSPVLHPLELPLWDRAPSIRREDDRRLFGLVVTVLASVFAVGVAWATANAKVRGKLDRAEQFQVDSRQDRTTDSLRLEYRAVLGAVRDVQAGVDAANVRLQQLVCDGKPPSCR